MEEQWSHAALFIHFPVTRSSKELLLVTCGCTTGNDGTHHPKIVVAGESYLQPQYQTPS